MRKMSPLPASFMLISIIGLIVTGVYTLSQRIALSWGMAFLLVFVLMFIASVLSITPSKEAARKEPVKGLQTPLIKGAPKPARKARKRGSKKRGARRAGKRRK